jgi:hypothetical protein
MKVRLNRSVSHQSGVERYPRLQRNFLRLLSMEALRIVAFLLMRIGGEIAWHGLRSLLSTLRP